MEEVAKHKKKDDVWVALYGRFLNVSTFLSQHPVGELAMLTLALEEATAESNAFIGVFGSGKAQKGKGFGRSALFATDKVMRLQIWNSVETGGWRIATTCQEYLW